MPREAVAGLGQIRLEASNSISFVCQHKGRDPRSGRGQSFSIILKYDTNRKQDQTEFIKSDRSPILGQETKCTDGGIQSAKGSIS